jgi:hypothetical protein
MRDMTRRVPGLIGLFYPELGATPTSKDEQSVYKNITRAFRRLRLAQLPVHHTPKSLRHIFGSQLLSRGISPAYVQEQLGHSSIQITVDTYGSWLPVQAPGAVDGFATIEAVSGLEAADYQASSSALSSFSLLVRGSSSSRMLKNPVPGTP